MVLRIIRGFRGYIVFKIYGNFPERFLNLINRRGIRHWDFVPDKDAYAGKMFLCDYMEIRPAARASSVRLRSTKRAGFPFFVKKYKRRWGLLLGALTAAVILIVMSQFVWDIRITGAEGLSTTELYSALEECGLKVGALKSGIDVESVERQMELKIPEVRWIAVNMLNNVADVEIKQQSERPGINKNKSPCNIKASADGVITDIVVSSGTCEVKRGSAVAKNQLLVNSVVPIGEDRQKYVCSKARIMADVIEEKSFKTLRNKSVLVPKRNYLEKSNLKFLFLSFPYGLSPSYKGARCVNTFNESLSINNVRLPLGRTLIHEYSFSLKERLLSPRDAEKILKTRMTLYECFCQSGSIVRQRKTKLTKNTNSYVLSVDYVFNKNIAKEQKLRIN